MDFLYDPQIQVILQLFLAAILGGLVGLEREYQKRAAGLRTHSLICLGSALLTIISTETFYQWGGETGFSFSPTYIIGSIALSVGFVGAGLIMHRGSRIEGLTTAVGIWVVAAVGIAIGMKLYLIGVFTAFLTLGILAGLRLLEEKVFGEKGNNRNE